MVNIQRASGQLGRTQPIDDNVICMVMSGTAVAGKIDLGDCKQIFSSTALTDLGITSVNNPLAFQEITDFYKWAGEGAELNFMLVVNTTSFADMCDTAKTIGKKLLDFTQGRGVILLLNKKFPVGYTATITNGLDNDINVAGTNLDALAKEFQTQNVPFHGILPAYGFTTATLANIPNRSTLNKDNVSLNAFCLRNDGIVSQGMLAGWITKFQVHQNIGRVASGKVSDTGFMPDAKDASELKYQWSTLNDKGLLFPYKIGGKSGYFFYDDPSLTPVSSDYSSLSWNRTINKVHRIAYGVLIEKQNEDVDVDPTTGKVDSALISDWESDVENAIRKQMMAVSSIKKKEISGVKCTIDPNSDIVNDKIDAVLSIVRKGQAKTINLKIGYGVTV